MSLYHKKLCANKTQAKNEEFETAIKYCEENNYKGLKGLNLKNIKDARTLKNHLLCFVKAADERPSQKLLTAKEERSLIKYLIKRNKAKTALIKDQSWHSCADTGTPIVSAG